MIHCPLSAQPLNNREECIHYIKPDRCAYYFYKGVCVAEEAEDEEAI
jgi:hypothetical protein